MKTMKEKATAIGKTVDTLGRIKAQIAELEAVEKKLRDELAAAGVEAVEGRLFRATVSTFTYTKTDYKAVVESLPPSSHKTSLINKHTESGERTTVKVVSR